MKDEETWVPPTDALDARNRMRQLQAEIEEIDAQLGSYKKKRDMPKDDWENWHDGAGWAKIYRVQQLRKTKDWLWDNG